MATFNECCKKFPALDVLVETIIENAKWLVPEEINQRWYGNGKYKDFGLKQDMVEIMDQQPEYSLVYGYLYDLLTSEVEKANQQERRICYCCAAFVKKGYSHPEYDGQCRFNAPIAGDEPWPTVNYRDFCMQFTSKKEAE